jgi:hypothetical protein
VSFTAHWIWQGIYHEGRRVVDAHETRHSVFAALGVKTKYGASTTWIGKLLPRLNAEQTGVGSASISAT